MIIIKNGKHILQELTVESYVPNDTFLSKEKNIALITGRFLVRIVSSQHFTILTVDVPWQVRT